MKKTVKNLYLQNKKRFLKKIIGTTDKPRLSVFRSNKHIYGQLIDDSKGITLASSSTIKKSLNIDKPFCKTQEGARLVGISLAKIAKEKNITEIIFDRGNRPYHGRIAAVATGARENGLIF